MQGRSSTYATKASCSLTSVKALSQLKWPFFFNPVSGAIHHFPFLPWLSGGSEQPGVACDPEGKDGGLRPPVPQGLA